MNKLVSLFGPNSGFSFLKLFCLLLSLFFIWGFALGLVEILSKNFQSIIQSNASISAFVLLTYYAGYFLMPLPASIFTNRFGYKYGIVLGLSLIAIGALMFQPNSYFHSTTLFLFSMFFIALGMAALETAANPCITLIGKKNLSAFRITLGHSFTSFGWLLGYLVAGGIVLEQNVSANQFEFAQLPFVGIGILVVFVAILISLSDLPKFKETTSMQLSVNNENTSKSLFRQRHFLAAVVAMAFFICAQTALFGLFSKYLFDLFKNMESTSVLGQNYILNFVRYIGGTNQLSDKLYLTVSGSIFIFGGLGFLTIGRFIGSIILIKMKVNKLLIISSVLSLLFSTLLWMNLGIISILALCLTSLSMSVMFPLIFSLGIRKLGHNTNRASAFIIMAISGGSLYPILIYSFNTINPISIGLPLLFISFLVIFIYALDGYKIKLAKK